MLKIPRAPDFSRCKERKLNSRGQYSNDAVWITIQRHSLIDNVGIAPEPCMPELVTDYDDWLARRLPFIWAEEPAYLRLDSQNVKKISRHPCRGHLQRLAPASEVEIVIGGSRHAGE